jgi:hypothetical protein
MANGAFDEVKRQLEATAAELQTAKDPDRRRMLLREMNLLLVEAERVISEGTDR